jgi:hypothetical protein
MKRAIPLLAAAFLGLTGCYTQCTDTELDVTWAFTDASGTVLSCPASGTATVRIFLDDLQLTDRFGNPTDFTCADGPTIPILGIPAGTHKLQLDAHDASGNLLYQYVNTNLPLLSCGVNPLSANLDAVQATMVVHYSIANAGNQCPSGSFVWYSIFDVTDNRQFDLVDGTHSPTAVPCGTVLTFDKALFGTYALDFIQIVVPTGNPSAPFGALYESCTPQTFDHSAPNDGIVLPPLQPATVFCQ